jgi:hypothetical protein
MRKELAKHLLLGQTGFGAKQFAYAIREIIVVRHVGVRTSRVC